MLSKHEAEIIAALPTDPAYILLMEKLQASVDDVTEKLYSAKNNSEAAEILPYWKALKTVVFELKYAPQDMTNYLDSIKSLNGVDGLEPDITAKNQLDTFMNNFNKMRGEHTEKLNELMPTWGEPSSPGNWL